MQYSIIHFRLVLCLPLVSLYCSLVSQPSFYHLAIVLELQHYFFQKFSSSTSLRKYACFPLFFLSLQQIVIHGDGLLVWIKLGCFKSSLCLLTMRYRTVRQAIPSARNTRVSTRGMTDFVWYRTWGVLTIKQCPFRERCSSTSRWLGWDSSTCKTAQTL